MASQPKNICIAFLGHPDLDTRVTNLIKSLEEEGHNVSVIGFNFREPNFETLKLNNKHVYKLVKNKFPISFYSKFLFYLWYYLRKSKFDIYIAEDVLTLPLMVKFARKNDARVFYNAREIYAHLGGLRKRPLVQKLISNIEKKYIGKVDWVFTTGEMDTEFLSSEYNLDKILTLRNLPVFNTTKNKFDFREYYNIPQDSIILLYQGVLLEGRGIIPTMEAIKQIPNAYFIVLGEGEFKQHFTLTAKELDIENRVKFYGSVPQEELSQYTRGADIGLSLIENISISYYYALPNKLFEYIMARIPVLVSNLPQMKNIVDKYRIGEVVTDLTSEQITIAIKNLIQKQKSSNELKENCEKAAAILNWDNEFEKLKRIL